MYEVCSISNEKKLGEASNMIWSECYLMARYTYIWSIKCQQAIFWLSRFERSSAWSEPSLMLFADLWTLFSLSQTFSSLKSERLVRSWRARYHSKRRNGGETMVPFAEQLVPLGTCHVRSRKPLQKALVKAAGQTNERIRFKFGGPIGSTYHVAPIAP